MVYGDGLENRCSRKGTVGSNPTPSATFEAEMPPTGYFQIGGIFTFANGLLTQDFYQDVGIAITKLS